MRRKGKQGGGGGVVTVILQKSNGCIIQQFMREWADEEKAGGVFGGKREGKMGEKERRTDGKQAAAYNMQL